MLAHYGVDVQAPDVTLRRVKVLIDRLPAGSWPEVDSPMNWSVESHLLATLVDSIAALTFVTLKAHGARSVKQPAPMPRPAAKRVPGRPPAGKPDAEQKVKTSSWMEFARLIADMPGVVTERG